MILVLDNYDSFTYNLVQYLGELYQPIEVVRNDVWSVDQVLASKPRFLVLSPGPGDPSQAGITLELIPRILGKIPTLGVCLGHQSIGEAFGAAVVSAPEIVHGKTSPVLHRGQGVFRGLPSPFPATRYHSLTVDPATLPASLRATAETRDGVLMGLEHVEHPLYGVQFHPESILTQEGKRLLANFLELGEEFWRASQQRKGPRSAGESP